LREIIYIAVAGSIGALSRYYMSGLVHRLFGDSFPYGTLAVNFIGSFLIGLIMQISLSTDLVPQNLRLALTVGFLGAFTTFSTFSYETIRYFEDGAWLAGGANILANVVLGIIAVIIGIFVGRTMLGGA
jgi:CrcB protein